MPKEILEKIRAAETDSAERIKKAGRKAGQIITDAEKEAFRIRQRATAESDTEYVAILNAGEAGSMKEAEVLAADTRAYIAGMIKSVKTRMDPAADHIVERILEIDVDS